MFGLEKISWTQFSLMILYATLLWYAGLFTWAWLRTRKRNTKNLFEYDDDELARQEVLIPVAVSAADFPREMISFAAPQNEALILDPDVDSDIDDGHTLELFADKDLSDFPEILHQIQVLQ